MTEINKRNINILVVFIILVSFILSSLFLLTQRNNDILETTHPNFSVLLGKSKSSTYYFYNDYIPNDSYLTNNYSISCYNNNDSIDKKVLCANSFTNTNNLTDYMYRFIFANEMNIIIECNALNLEIIRYNSTHYKFTGFNTYYFETDYDCFNVNITHNYGIGITFDIETIVDTYSFFTDAIDYGMDIISFNITTSNLFLYYYSNVLPISELEMITTNTYPLGLLNNLGNIEYNNILDNTSYISSKYRISLNIITIIYLHFSDINIFIQPDSYDSLQFLSLYQKRIIEFNTQAYCYLVDEWNYNIAFENYAYVIQMNFEFYPDLFVI